MLLDMQSIMELFDTLDLYRITDSNKSCIKISYCLFLFYVMTLFIIDSYE